MGKQRIAVLGGGIAGCCIALALAREGLDVDLIDQADELMTGASLHNEGKLHLGYVYAADTTGRTHALMARGSLAFLGIVSHLTGVPREQFHVSQPFAYAVPHDSQLDLARIAAHVDAVDQAIASLGEQENAFFGAALPTRASAMRSAGDGGPFDADTIGGWLQTGEISVDTGQVATILRQSVRAHPRIRLHLGHAVQHASRCGTETVRIVCDHQQQSVAYDYRFCVNALWGDRLRVDATLGIMPPRPWLMRYKAAIYLQLREGCRSPLPSATFICGPYGDIVNHGNGKIYASWYPACKLAESRDMSTAGLFDAARQAGGDDLLRRSLDGLGRFVPGMRDIMDDVESVSVGGGVIFAWGTTDITDTGSGLHQRFAIGSAGDRQWASIDTGKYCMGPYLALELVQEIAPLLLEG